MIDLVIGTFIIIAVISTFVWILVKHGSNYNPIDVDEDRTKVEEEFTDYTHKRPNPTYYYSGIMKVHVLNKVTNKVHIRVIKVNDYESPLCNTNMRSVYYSLENIYIGEVGLSEGFHFIINETSYNSTYFSVVNIDYDIELTRIEE